MNTITDWDRVSRPSLLDTNKANFIMTQEYYDFIEFLQNDVGFDQVYEWQEKFGGSFTKPE